MAALQLMTCGICGCAVFSDMETAHAKWHAWRDHTHEVPDLEGR